MYMKLIGNILTVKMLKQFFKMGELGDFLST